MSDPWRHGEIATFLRSACRHRRHSLTLRKTSKFGSPRSNSAIIFKCLSSTQALTLRKTRKSAHPGQIRPLFSSACHQRRHPLCAKPRNSAASGPAQLWPSQESGQPGVMPTRSHASQVLLSTSEASILACGVPMLGLSSNALECAQVDDPQCPKATLDNFKRT